MHYFEYLTLLPIKNSTRAYGTFTWFVKHVKCNDRWKMVTDAPQGRWKMVVMHAKTDGEAGEANARSYMITYILYETDETLASPNVFTNYRFSNR